MRILSALHLPIAGVVVCSVIGLYPIAAIYAWDCHKRFKEYRKIKTCAASERLFNIYSGSYCQRSVVMAVFKEARDYYRQQGYKWYHLLPDGWPRAAFTLKWWRDFLR